MYKAPHDVFFKINCEMLFKNNMIFVITIGELSVKTL